MKQWEVSFRVECHNVDGKDAPSKKELKAICTNLVEGITNARESTLRITNKSQGGGRCKQIGSDFERTCAKVLGEWWWGKPFRRTPNSGAWDKQALDGSVEAAGDLFTPDEAQFPWTVECKHRKEELNLFNTNKDADGIEKWWEQCCGDAQMAKKAPLLVMRCGRTDYVAFDFNLDCNSAAYLFDMGCWVPSVLLQQEKKADAIAVRKPDFVVMLLKHFLVTYRRADGPNTTGAGTKSC